MARRLERNDGVLRIVEQRLGALGRETGDHVHLTTLQSQDLRFLTGIEGKLSARQQRLGTPVALVGYELGAVVLCVAGELPRARPDERALPLAEVRSLGDDDRVVGVRGD